MEENQQKKGIRKFVCQVATFSQLENSNVLVLAGCNFAVLLYGVSRVIGTTLINAKEKLWRSSIERAQNKFQRCPSFPFSRLPAS
jgi:hypothetical protein